MNRRTPFLRLRFGTAKFLKSPQQLFRSWITGAFLVSAIPPVLAAQTSLPASYTVTPLPAFSASQMRAYINNSGQVAVLVQRYPDPGQQDVLYVTGANGQGISTIAQYRMINMAGLNDAGQVLFCGYNFTPTDSTCHGYIGSTTAMVSIPLPPGATDLQLLGLNNSGQVLLSAGNQLYIWRLSDGFTPVLLPPACRIGFSAPLNINNHGEMALECFGNNSTSLFVLSGSNITPITTPSETTALNARGFNDIGQITIAPDDVPYIVTSHTITPIPLPSNLLLYMGAISRPNTSGQVILQLWNGASVEDYIGNGTGVKRINDLMPVGWHVLNAVLFPLSAGLTAGLNESGQIVASVTGPNSFKGLAILNPAASSSCQVKLPTVLSQRDTTWATHPYNTTGADTIGGVGCALTSLSMALNFAGLNTAPDALNDFMNTVGGYRVVKNSSGGLDAYVKFDTTTSAASTGLASPFKLSPIQKLKFVSKVANSIVDSAAAAKVLSDALCGTTPTPVIVGVDLTPVRDKKTQQVIKYTAGHFVLVTGKETKSDGTAKFLIADPYFNDNPSSSRVAVRTSLDDYSNHYETRGSVIDPLDDNSRLNLTINGAADILLIDPLGRRTGFDSVNDVMLDEIPGGSAWSDRLDNDDSGEVDTAFVNYIEVLKPLPGSYQIRISGYTTGSYTFTQNVISQDGTLQPETTVNASIDEGAIQNAAIQLVTTPGGSSTLGIVDMTPPVITPLITGTLGNNGWYVSNVTVSWSATDPESGIANSSGCDSTSVTADTAGVTFICSATNGAGLSASKSLAIKVDKTPPVATATPVPAPNANGWNDTNVTVSFTGTDNVSGIDFCSAPLSMSNEAAGQTASGTCTDKAGNVSTPALAKVSIDKTPPAISGMPAAACTLWPPNHKLVQVATVTAADALSGLVPGSFKVTGTSNEPIDPNDPAIVITPNGSGGFVVQLQADRLGMGSGRVYTLTATANDLAGNTATTSATCTVPHDAGK